MLGAEASDFFASFSADAEKAFHLNRARITASAFESCLPAVPALNARPFFDSHVWRYQASEDLHIGSTAMHHAGVLYSQDPAAALPVPPLPLGSDLRILDLCAAPGGKSSQLAQAVDGGTGYLVANEPNPSRNRILIGNMERMGYRNVIVTCLDPSELATVYPEHFDLILVDAPCSGEGMFRKYPESVGEWSEEAVTHCADRQRDILRSAAACLKPGGRLIYSTCTYAPEEDEEQVDFMIRELGFLPAVAHPAVTANALQSGPCSWRCYPHRFAGEGQFMAYLQKAGTPSDGSAPGRIPSGIDTPNRQQTEALKELFGDDTGKFAFLCRGKRIFLLPALPPRLPSHGLSLLGVTVAEWDDARKRYLPHHQFFSAYGASLSRTLSLPFEDPLLRRYLNGQELVDESGFSKGLGAILTEGVALGGFRAAGGRLKNLYPKGLREAHL